MIFIVDFFEKDNITSNIIQFLLENQIKYEIIIKKSITDDFFNWFNSNITTLMNYKQRVQYAVS